MKYFEKIRSIKMISIFYILIWIISLFVFWFYIKGDGEGIIIWGVLFMWLVMPCATIISSAVISCNINTTNFLHKIRLCFIIIAIFTLLFFILGYLTFDLNVMIMDKSFMPLSESEALLNVKFGFVGSIIGTLIGSIISFIKKRRGLKN